MTAKKTDKERLNRRRTAHHRALETLRAESCTLSGMQIWRRLKGVERAAHACALAFCNGESVTVSWPHMGIAHTSFADESAWEICVVSRAHDCVRNILGHVPEGFFVNADARGHALKLDGEAVEIPEGMDVDWGGDGILAATIED